MSIDLIITVVFFALFATAIAYLPKVLSIVSFDVPQDTTQTPHEERASVSVSIDAESLPFYVDELKIALDNKAYDRAEDFSNQILAVFPEDLQVLRLLANAFLEHQNYGKADVTLRKIISLQKPTLVQNQEETTTPSPEAKELAVLLHQLGTALESLEKNVPSPQNERGELRSSFDAYYEALLYDPQNADAHLALGSLMERLDFPHTDYLLHFIEAFRNNPRLSTVGVKVAKISLLDKDFPQAILYFNKVLLGDPQNTEALAGAGIAYLMHQQLPKARDILEQAVAAGLEDASVFSNLGHIYSKLEDLPRAAHYYGRSVELEPTAQRQYKLGQIFELQENIAAAFACYESAMLEIPDNTTYLEAVAQTAQALGEEDKSFAVWQKIAELDPENKKAMQAIARGSSANNS